MSPQVGGKHVWSIFCWKNKYEIRKLLNVSIELSRQVIPELGYKMMDHFISIKSADKCVHTLLYFSYFLLSHFVCIYSIAPSIRTNAPAHIHTLVENGKINKLVWYDRGGCLNTNFAVIGVGMVKYSKMGIRSKVAYVTIPGEKIVMKMKSNLTHS